MRHRQQDERFPTTGFTGSPGPDPERTLVLAIVGPYDRRALAAARYALSIASGPARALHVATDGDAAHHLGLRWMELGWADPAAGQLPLDVVEPRGPVAVTVAEAVRAHVASGYEQVTAVVAEMCFGGLGRHLFHDHTAGSIAASLSGLPGVTTLIVPVGPRS